MEKGKEQEKVMEGELKIIHGDVNIGVKGKHFTAMFSKAEGGACFSLL